MISAFKRIMPLLMLGLLTLALWNIYHQLHEYSRRELLEHLHRIPSIQVVSALLLTASSYLVMTVYDFLALKYIGHRLPYGKTALASFLGYTFSNNMGFAMLAGASIRYRIYSAWGLSALEITQVVLFCSVSLLLGFVGLSGFIFVLDPMKLPSGIPLPFSSTLPVGLLLLLILAGYMSLTLSHHKTITIRDWQFTLPQWPLAAAQLTVAATDWFLASTVLYALLPQPAAIPLGHFLAIFILAQSGGLMSQVPGGLGVFESIILMLTAPAVSKPDLISALIVYRAIYYLLPFLIATATLGGQEILRRKTLLAQTREVAERAWRTLLVPVLSLAVFIAGAVLLFSGALPAASDRLAFLKRAMPLTLMEASHFIGSLVGMGLLFLARGLQRRLDAAWVFTLFLLAVGMAASLSKGFDYEEACLLAGVFIVLLPARPLFFRRASLFSERFSSSWLATIATVFLTTVWLGLFVYRHVDYRHDLWWQFSLHGDAPRFMRASVGAAALALGYALARLLRPAPPGPHPPTEAELASVQTIVSRSANATSHLALLGDKRFLINTAGSAFIMYGVSGRSWVSMGDPIGPEDEWRELIWQFHRNAQRFADFTVFYEVAHHHLHLYLDVGLAALKLGEEGRVPLGDFSLEGSRRKGLRYLQRKLARLGCTFEILPADVVPQYLSTLQTISDSWLVEKKTSEKGFSLGFFEPAYLCRTPVALVRVDGEPVAFTNLWPGAELEELTVDLMRYLPGAPNGVMEYLFIETMLWGRNQGYRWFNLGMAPLSGMENSEFAPLWHKMGHWVARYGEHFYNFEGLRRFKEKFNPVWRPKYLICPGGLALLRVLPDVGGLVSGGLKGILFK